MTYWLLPKNLSRAWRRYEAFDYSEPVSEGWQEDALHAAFMYHVERLSEAIPDV